MAEPLVLGKLESFFVGGTKRRIATPSFGEDEIVIGATYVQHLGPVRPVFPYPVIFLHGGIHTGVTWETAPDGREGWQTLFVRRGFDTYVIDQAWRGRSAPDLSGLMPGMQPLFEVDPAFICGLSIAKSFTRGGTRFDADSLDHYAKQFWPDFGVHTAFSEDRPGQSDHRALPPLLELIDRLGRVVLVTHSQGAHLGWMATLARPAAVAAILAIEPAQTTPGLDDPAFPDIPVCLMWGDNLPEDGPILSLRDVAVGRAISAARPKVEVDMLPDADIFGNGHMLMMEDNSEQLADRAMSWLKYAVT